MNCIKCGAQDIPEPAIKDGKCVNCRSQENSWQEIMTGQPVENLIDQEFVWLAFADGSVRMGRYVAPPFSIGLNHPRYYFGTILMRNWDSNDLPTHWKKVSKPKHPFVK